MSGTAVLGVPDGLVRMQVADAAAAFASRTGRAVCVVHVHTGPHQTWDGDAGVRTRDYLGRRVPSLAVDRLCTVGDPAEALLDAVRPDGVVVLGDRHVRLGTLAGRTTLDVVAGAVCPVLVVPEYRPSAGGAVRRGGVVAALDGSTADGAVLAAAADASGAGPAPVRILDAAPDRRESVDELLGRVPAAPTVIEVRSTVGLLDEALPEAARGAGLVVVGLPPSDSASSVGVRLLAHAPCPVLLVPAAEHRPRATTPVDAAGPAV